MPVKLNRSPFAIDRRDIENVVAHAKLVADESRLQILSFLSNGPQNVTAICTEMKSSQPVISHHLALLRVSGILENRRDGKSIIYSITDLGWRLIDGVRGQITEGAGK